MLRQAYDAYGKVILVREELLSHPVLGQVYEPVKPAEIETPVEATTHKKEKQNNG